MFELLEPRIDLPHLLDSAESGASLSRRRRIHEHLEDSDSGLTDPGADAYMDEDDNDDDDDDDGTGRDVPGVPT